MQPHTSYTIWTSQRTGSSLLCKALEATGIAGKPNEWLHDAETFDLFKTYKVDTPKALQHKLWEVGTSANGVFGLKVSMYEPHNTKILEQFQRFPGCSRQPKHRAEIWACAFPNSKHIFMTRRNKVRLAVSWWKAIKSEEWHRRAGAGPNVPNVKNDYLFEAIDHLLVEACMREAAIQEFFTEGGIVPLTIFYEDFTADYDGTVEGVLDFLGLKSENPQTATPFYDKLADEVSEAWVQRFRSERQQGWASRW